jgi:hypothetical protein
MKQVVVTINMRIEAVVQHQQFGLFVKDIVGTSSAKFIVRETSSFGLSCACRLVNVFQLYSLYKSS